MTSLGVEKDPKESNHRDRGMDGKGSAKVFGDKTDFEVAEGGKTHESEGIDTHDSPAHVVFDGVLESRVGGREESDETESDQEKGQVPPDEGVG